MAGKIFVASKTSKLEWVKKRVNSRKYPSFAIQVDCKTLIYGVPYRRENVTTTEPLTWCTADVNMSQSATARVDLVDNIA